MPQPYTFGELKDVIAAEFAIYELGNAPMTVIDGSNVYLCGVTNTADWAPQSTINEARDWWLGVKHRELMESNAGYRRNMGSAWSPKRYAQVRGPAVKLYSHGRSVTNFEFIDDAANRNFNFHVPAFPRGLAVLGAPAAIPPSLHGWKLEGGGWVRRGPPQYLPPVWGKPASVVKDPRGF